MASRAGSTKKQNGKDQEVKPERAEEMKSETSAAMGVNEMIGQFLSKLITGDSFRLETVPPLPPPEKFTLGGNYPRWEVQARAYAQKFPESERKVAILGLLAGEAADRAFQSSAFEEEDLDGVFRKLRCLLDTPLHPIEYQSQFHSARQNIGETVEAYAYRVKQLVSKAFPDDNSEAQDKRAVERFVEGVSGASVKKALITKSPKSLSEAVALAGETEKLQRAVHGAESLCLTLHHQGRQQREPIRRPWGPRPRQGPTSGEYRYNDYRRRWSARSDELIPPSGQNHRGSSSHPVAKGDPADHALGWTHTMADYAGQMEVQSERLALYSSQYSSMALSLNTNSWSQRN
ncbi:unnamed protein product [Echinostoma caproni]|uniref:Retrotrans_gag domain-containing protein n=1 Tax=Echinostoma caproni TaxID=27848 RepID=A0A183BBA2_9TREM|nr:unnamed protein product [Echinostoma caproni]